MEALRHGLVGIAHYLDARSSAIQWSTEPRAPVQQVGSLAPHPFVTLPVTVMSAV